MSAEQENSSASKNARAAEPPIELRGDETLIDLFDRMDREAFRRSLELRDARLIGNARTR